MRLNYLLYILPYLFDMAAYADYSTAYKEFIKDSQTVEEKGQKEAADFINALKKPPQNYCGGQIMKKCNLNNISIPKNAKYGQEHNIDTSNNNINREDINDSNVYTSKTEVLVFISLSLGSSTLKKLYKHSKKIGARLILRGLYKDSLLLTQQKIKELRIGVDIDPPLFERFNIQEVPTFILTEPHQEEKSFNYDILKGNVTLQFALEKFVAEGEIKEAKLLLEKLNGAPHA